MRILFGRSKDDRFRMNGRVDRLGGGRRMDLHLSEEMGATLHCLKGRIR